MLTAEDIVECQKVSPSTIMFPPKEFEPSHTLDEKLQIEKSLSEVEKIISSERVKKLGTLSQATWHPELKMAQVILQVGSHWNKLGKRINNQLYLYPEESLYMLENGSLEIMFNGVSMSIQRAYFILLESDPWLSFEKYRVYSHLNSLGYKVVRHLLDNFDLESEKSSIDEPSTSQNSSKKRLNIINTETERDCNKKLKIESQAAPLKGDKEHVGVLKNLQIINCFDDFPKSSLTFDFDIYQLTKTNLNKYELKKPDSRVIVHRGSDPMPNLRDLAGLTRKFNDEVPVTHAIVFSDHIAFYQICPVNLPSPLNL